MVMLKISISFCSLIQVSVGLGLVTVFWRLLRHLLHLLVEFGIFGYFGFLYWNIFLIIVLICFKVLS